MALDRVLLKLLYKSLIILLHEKFS